MATTATLHPQFKPWADWLFSVGEYYNLHPRFTSTFRSLAKQEDLYRRRQRGEHPLPVAPPGRSMHNYGWAFDLVSDDNNLLGTVWRHYGGIWGGSKDWVHFSPWVSVDSIPANLRG